MKYSDSLFGITIPDGKLELEHRNIDQMNFSVIIGYIYQFYGAIVGGQWWFITMDFGSFFAIFFDKLLNRKKLRNSRDASHNSDPESFSANLQ